MRSVSRVTRKIRPARRVLARLTLLLFALRALVPAGYMPDLGAAKAGEVRIVLCTGAGTRLLLVDESGQPIAAPGADKAKHAADCPFAMASGKAVASPEPVLARTHGGDASPFAPPASDATLRPPAQGPPLGPRAPPVFLA